MIVETPYRTLGRCDDGNKIERHIMNETYRFPAEFIWGASTAAHQIEGKQRRQRLVGLHTNVREPSGDVADSYNRYEEDIRLPADAGLGMYRFSME